MSNSRVTHHPPKDFMKQKNNATSLLYAQEFLAKTPEETLAEALRRTIAIANEKHGYIPLVQLSEKIASDLENGNLIFTTKNDQIEDDDDALTGPITKPQIGYIAGLTEKLGYDRYDLPSRISPESNYKELTEGQAIKVIDTLLEEEKALQSK